MISRPQIKHMPGSTEHGPLDGMSGEKIPPFQVGTATYCPASEWFTGISVTPNGQKVIVVGIAYAQTGLSQALTAEGARTVAASLNHLASVLENEATKLAAEAIERARRSGGAS